MNRPAKITQGEIARAIRAVKKAGGDFCVELAPDGTIRIVPISSQRVVEKPEIAPTREIVL